MVVSEAEQRRVLASFPGEEGSFSVPQPPRFAALPPEEWSCYLARDARAGEVKAWFRGPGGEFSVTL